jgi:phage-related minor tail protein
MTSSSRYTSSSSSGSSVQSLMVEVRAATSGFTQDLTAMRSTFDSSLVSGFTQAGAVLDTSLSNALKKGTSGFTDLRTVGLGAIADIAAQATGLFSSGTSSSSTSGLGSLLSAITGLPGRATGGPVSPGQAYMVGERGPEMFVPTSAGSVANNASLNGGGGRNVNVSINVAGAAGGDAPQAMARSSRQVASALRRALSQN